MEVSAKGKRGWRGLISLLDARSVPICLKALETEKRETHSGLPFAVIKVPSP